MKIVKKYSIEIWYEETAARNIFAPVLYRQSKTTGRKLGYFEKKTQTKVRNIKNASPEIIAKLPPKTRNEIRRAEKEGVSTIVDADLAEFVKMQQNFVFERNLNILISLENFAPYKEKLFITKAVYENKTIVAHMYLLDDVELRSRLLYSVSIGESAEKKVDRNIVGYANRLLHYKDMLALANLGMEIYDLGGYSFDVSSGKLNNINKFKDEFGDELLIESNYETWLYALFTRVSRFIG